MSDATPPKRGRPPSVDGPRRDVLITLSEDERAQIDAACGEVPRARWIREAAIRAAKKHAFRR